MSEGMTIKPIHYFLALTLLIYSVVLFVAVVDKLAGDLPPDPKIVKYLEAIK